MSENLFVIDENSNDGTSKYIGIRNEDDFIKFGKLTKYAISEDGKYIEANFTTKDGLSLRFDKRYNLPISKENYKSEEKYNKAVQIFLNNMVNIGKKFKGDTYKVSGTDALDLAKKVIADITPLMKTKDIWAFFELEEKEKGIFPNLGSFSPFGNTKEELVGKVTSTQKNLLEKRKTGGAKPDADVKFDTTAKPSDDLPF